MPLSRRGPGPYVLGTVVLLSCITAVPSAGRAQEPYPSGDARLDAFVKACRPAVAAYTQALSTTNPPEVVEVLLRGLVMSLRGVSDLTDAERAERRAAYTAQLDPGSDALQANPAGPAAAEAALCIVKEAQESSRRTPDR